SSHFLWRPKESFWERSWQDCQVAPPLSPRSTACSCAPAWPPSRTVARGRENRKVVGQGSSRPSLTPSAIPYSCWTTPARSPRVAAVLKSYSPAQAYPPSCSLAICPTIAPARPASDSRNAYARHLSHPPGFLPAKRLEWNCRAVPPCGFVSH